MSKSGRLPHPERTPFPETHPLYAGGLPFAIAPLSKKLEGHDLAIVIGAPVFRYYPYIAGSIHSGRITLAAHYGRSCRSGTGAGWRQPFERSGTCTGRIAGKSETTQGRSSRHRQTGTSDGTVSGSKNTGEKTDGPISSLELFLTLRASTPEDTILVEESPSNLGELHTACPSTNPIILHLCQWQSWLEPGRQYRHCDG